MSRSVHESGQPAIPAMDGGDTPYAARRKSDRAAWTLLTSSFAFIVLLGALCLFFFFHPRTCRQLQLDGYGYAGGAFGSTDTILDEIRGVDYERLENAAGAADVRLPAHVVPESYALRIVPYLWAGNSTFRGQVDVVVNVTAPVDEITLHAADLNMTEYVVTR